VAADHELVTASAYWLVYPESKAHLPAVGQFRDWLLNMVPAETGSNGESAADHPLECALASN
jgi:DNA-binding transcriptional LysR family regulator